jgi:DNA gyrase subunit A
MRLQRLTGMERDKIVKEYEEIMKLIDYLNEILNSFELRMKIIKDELIEVRDRYGDERRTQIVFSAEEFSMEDMIADEDMVITISKEGYIKRTSLVEYKTQNRGGRGSRGVSMKNDDYTEQLFVANTHSYLLIFTEKGKVFWVKVYEIPEGGKTSKGRNLQNVINIDQDDKARAIININNLSNPDYINNHYLVMCTVKGTIKKTSLEAFSRPRSNGITAIGIHEGDQLLDVKLCGPGDEIVIALRSGRSIRFIESNVRAMGRTASGVRGIRLANAEDRVVGIATLSNPEQSLLVVSQKGYGKRTSIEHYRITKRGGKGVRTLNVTEKTGQLIGILDVENADDLMIINKSGVIIRLAVSKIREIGRVSQGVRLIKLDDADEISSIAKIKNIEDEEALEEDAEGLDSILVVGDEAEELEVTEEEEEEEEEDDSEEEEAGDEPESKA